MSWLSVFTSAGRAAVKESATAAKVLTKSGAEMAEEAARSVGVHAGQAERVAEESARAVESLNRSATEVAEEVARIARSGVKEEGAIKSAEILSRVSKTLQEASKTAAGNVERAAAAGERLSQSAAKTMESAQKISEQAAKGKSAAEKLAATKLYALYGVGGYLLYNKVFNGKGLVGSAGEVILDEQKEGEGIGHSVWRQLVGDKAADKSLVGAGVDTMFGDGTYDGSLAMLKNGGNAVGNTFSGISDTLQGFLHQAGGPGMPYPTNQYYDPSYYNVVANPQNYAGLSGDRAFLQQAALMNGMDGVFGRLNAMTGKNNINAFNLAEMALAAFLTFGPFGKIAKIGGLFLGANSYKNMSQEREVQNVAQSVIRSQQQQMEMMRGNGVPQYQMPMDEEPENVIHRSRSV